jgi:hypothetical protein
MVDLVDGEDEVDLLDEHGGRAPCGNPEALRFV